MTSSVEIGREWEEVAVNHLKKQGYKILETNWRLGHNELDIIALDKDTLVFAEVKARKQGGALSPAAAVNRGKQRTIIRAANAYILRYNMDHDARFDIIAIEYNKESYTLEHIDGAFYPTL